MRRTTVWTVLLVVASCNCVAGAQNNEKWRLGTQAYSFNRFTFYEAAEKTQSLNLKYIEAYPQQKVGGEVGDVVFSDMNPAQRQQVKQMLKDAGITLVNYGVVGLTNDEQDCRKVFDFAKDMGIETIVSEPPEDAFKLIDRLCQEYQIGVAVHNHPKPTHYWNPNTVMKVCRGRSKWIGACADTGHWTRSGIDPLRAVQMLGRAGRIRSFHFKDLNEFGVRGAHDVPWGTGVSKAREILAELAKQGFEGVFSIEYEYNWDNSVPEIRKCVEWFRRTSAELSDVQAKDVFQPDLSNAVMPPDGWAFDADGVLTPAPGGHGDIWTKERYGNFILELDFKVPEGGNSGVFLRTGSIENWINTAIEVQIHATTDCTKYGQCGAIYDCLGPSKDANKGPDQWNHYVITCLDNKIYVNLNGQDIIDMDLDRWTEAGKNPDGTPNKFTTAYKDMPREGHLGLQYHGNPVWFRNIRIKDLSPKSAGSVAIFNGRNLDGWTTNSGSGKADRWVIGQAKLSASNPKQLENAGGEGEMINLTPEHGSGQDIYSKAKFGDCRIELEVMVPQGSNSGIYVMGEYEIQVLDSFGRETMGSGDMGAIYGGFAPAVNASKRPGQWQKYVIEWRAPRFDGAGNKIKDAEFVKIELNGQVLHRNLIMPGVTPGGVTGKEAPEGPLMFQGNHGPVAYRNILVKPLLPREHP